MVMKIIRFLNRCVSSVKGEFNSYIWPKQSVYWVSVNPVISDKKDL